MVKDQKLRDTVKDLLYENISEGYSHFLGKHYCYIQPATKSYPFQYFWDTCFHVFMLCDVGEYELAKRNIQSLFALQEENGFVGHMIFWQRALPRRASDVLQARPTLSQFRPHMSAIIQPSLVAQAVKKIYEKTKDRQFVKIMRPKLDAYFQWLIQNRDFDESGLISIISPFESGIDWKPSFDEVVGFHKGRANWQLFVKSALITDGRNFLHRYNLPAIYKSGHFLVKDVMVNTMYIRDLLAFVDLCEIVGDSTKAQIYKDRAKRATKELIRISWSEKHNAFLDVYGKNNRQIPILTPTIFLPMLLPDVPDAMAHAVIEEHLSNQDEFALPYPLPSVAKNTPAFNPKESLYIWRGPTWVVFNWFLYQCLYCRGHKKEAVALHESVKTLIAQSGFREYYNPLTGEGYGAKNFTWSGLIVDMYE